MEVLVSLSSSVLQKRSNSSGQGGRPKKKAGLTYWKYNGFRGYNDHPYILRHAYGYYDENRHSKMVCPDLKDSKK
jgi:hypothetical protein